MSETKTYYKNFATMLSGNVLSQMIPLLLMPLLTRLYSAAEIGVQTNFLAIASMIGIIAAGRLELAIPISKEKTGAQEIVFTGLMLTIALSLLSFIFPLFSDFFGEMYNSPELSEYLILIPVAVFSFGLLGIANNWVLRSRKYRILSLGKVTQSVLNNSLAALFGYLTWGPEGLIFGWLIAQLLSVLVLASSMDRGVNIKDYNFETVKRTVREYKDFPLINSLHAFTDIFATQFVLFWIISSSYGLAELGLFALMHRAVRQPVVLITSSVSSIFYAEASAAINDGRSPMPILKKTISTSAAFSIPFVLVLVFLAPTLFAWYFGEDWRIAGSYAQRIIPILFLLFIVSPISSIPILLGKQKMAYLIVTIGYVCTLGSLFLTTFLKWTFLDALTVYSCVHAALQLVYFYWMYTSISKHHAHTE